jgi:hypothetical protein
MPEPQDRPRNGLPADDVSQKEVAEDLGAKPHFFAILLSGTWLHFAVISQGFSPSFDCAGFLSIAPVSFH